MGLNSVVTHGWGRRLTNRLAENELPNSFINGERYTNSEVMWHTADTANETGREFLAGLIGAGVKAEFLDYTKGVIIAQNKSKQGYGSNNGDVLDVNIAPILDCLDANLVPIVSPIGLSANGTRLFNINASSASTAITMKMNSVRYLMVTSSGGVLNGERIISSIYLSSDEFAIMKGDRIISGGMLKNVEEASRNLESQVGGDRIVQIVGPNDIIKALFSAQGAGTCIKK